MSFVAMPPGQWDKVNSQTGEPRIDILKRIVKSGEKLPRTDGVEIKILNTPDNMEAILRLEKEKKPQKLETDLGTIVTSKIGKSPVFGGASAGSGGGWAAGAGPLVGLARGQGPQGAVPPAPHV